MDNSYGKPGKKSKPAPKGSHYMPDGSLMKDSEHKGKSSGASRKPSRLDALMRNYLRSTPQVAQAAAETNIFNPFPSVTEAVGQGRVPTGGELGLDAGFLAAGFLPVGKAAGRLNSIVKRLNKSTDVADFMTERATRYGAPNYANQGLYRGPGSVGGFTDENLPEPASEYLFGLVPTEKLSPLREFDRAAESVGGGRTGPDNLKKLANHMAEGGRWDDPTSVAYYINPKTGYLAEGNHRLALAEALGLEQLPTRVWRKEGVDFTGVGKYLGDLDVNQLTVNAFGDPYIPPDMHPYLLKYFQPGQ